MNYWRCQYCVISLKYSIYFRIFYYFNLDYTYKFNEIEQVNTRKIQSLLKENVLTYSLFFYSEALFKKYINVFTHVYLFARETHLDCILIFSAVKETTFLISKYANVLLNLGVTKHVFSLNVFISSNFNIAWSLSVIFFYYLTQLCFRI